MTIELPLNPPNPLQSDSSSASTLEELLDWRVRDRIRTVAAGLVLCLHLGVDPPDVWKPSPCARCECWIDPTTGNPIPKVGIETTPEDDGNHLTLHLKSGQQAATSSNNSTDKIRENIARNLLLQYENWQPRVRYKTLLDPTSDDLRKLCTSLRKSARSERVLIHYNGHGVPRPTRNGELWVFNKQFTQYIPVNVADVVSWTGWPAVWILDCPAAAFLSHALQKVVTSITTDSSHGSSTNMGTSTIISSTTATSTGGTVVTSSSVHSESSSDPLKLIVFAACDSHETLPFTPSLPADILTSCLTTPLDMAIRWHCYIGGPLLPKSLHINSALQIPGKLSDRRTALGELNWIFTAITDTIAWLVLPRDLFRRLYRQDLLIASLSRNYLLAQRILKSLYCTTSTFPSLPPSHQHNLWTLWDHALDTLLAQMSEKACKHNGASPCCISQSTFFPDQLDAFELWLRQHQNLPATQISGPPDQLPAALQVLLSQNLRPRALKLFAEFCDFGPWACLECLHVGIHPYILKLIGSTSTATNNNSVTRSLLHIWTRLMSVDPSCKADLLKDSAFTYFINAFQIEPKLAAKAIVTFCLDNLAGKDAVINNETFKNILSTMTFTEDTDETVWKLLLSSERSAHDLKDFLLHDSPEIRAAAVIALNLKDLPEFFETLIQDASPLVRLELLNKTGDFKLFENDPFDAISEKAKNKQSNSFFAANFDNFTGTKSSKVACNLEKHCVLNQLEVDAWLERPLPSRKLDIQLAVSESPYIITQIHFHPSASLIYFLDSAGTFRRWNWQDDPDIDFDDLDAIQTTSTDFKIIGDCIYFIDQIGNIKIRSLNDDKLTSAFNCRDTNPKLLECKNGHVLIVGDNHLSMYNPWTQKLKSTLRTEIAPVSALVEIENGFLVGTESGTIEVYNHNFELINTQSLTDDSGIVEVFSVGGVVHVISEDASLYHFDPNSCECIKNNHFGTSGTGITSFAHHPVLPNLFAYGSTDQSIKLCERQAAELVKLQSIRYHDGFLGQRLGNINKVTWHPQRMVLGTITSETFLTIYGTNNKQEV